MIAEVTVVPRSGRFSVSAKQGKVKIFLKSGAEQNKANMELIKELSKALKAEVRIISGLKSRHKKIELSIGEDAWNDYLSSL